MLDQNKADQPVEPKSALSDLRVLEAEIDMTHRDRIDTNTVERTLKR
jgi:hypothetical protein